MDKGPLDSSKQSCQTHTHKYTVLLGHNWWLDPKGPKDHESSTGFNEETQHTIEHYWKSTKKRNSSNNKRKRLQGTTAQRKMLHRLVELNDRMVFLLGLAFIWNHLHWKWLRCQTISIQLTNQKNNDEIVYFQWKLAIVWVGVCCYGYCCRLCW